jgi:hypothetical protein
MPYKSSNSRSFGEIVKHWGLLVSGLLTNALDLSHLEGHRAELESIVTQAMALLSEQQVQSAAKQDLSRRVEVLLNQGGKIASFLRLGVKTKYGIRSEKLTEFDLLPFRGKAQPVKPAVVKQPATPTAPTAVPAVMMDNDTRGNQ